MERKLGGLAEAVGMAVELHAGQVRKGTTIPYVSHPLAVCAMVLEAGGTEAEACAAVCHDLAEDCGGVRVLARIVCELGLEVAEIVAGCTDSAEEEGVEKAPWRERKEKYLKHLKTASKSVRLVSVCDKVHNAGAIARDVEAFGPEVWERFKGGREGTLWYYGELAKELGCEERLGKLLVALVEVLRSL